MGERDGRSGFSLLELTTALFVLTLGLFGAVQMFQLGLAKMRVVNEAGIAVRAVQNEIETLRSLPFSELGDVQSGPFISETPETANLVNASTSVSIRDYGEPETALKEVTVRIVWAGEHGRTIKKVQTTLIADKGIE